MKSTYQERLNACLKRIVSRLPAEATAAQAAFVRQFFATMPVVDLEKADEHQAVRVALSAFAFADHRSGSQPKVRAFHPVAGEHGYDSRRFVVELLNDDMPFLVDSFSAELMRLGFSILETAHPIFYVTRDRKGRLENVQPPGKADKKTRAESLIHFELSPLPAALTHEVVEQNLRQVLEYIRASVSGWQAMTERMQKAETLLKEQEKKLGAETAQEMLALLSWLRSRNFIFLGYVSAKEKLGICTLDDGIALKALPDAPLAIAKSDRKSPVHRSALMDVITVKLPEMTGQFVGLFTSTVYYQTVDAIPVVRQKVASIMERSELNPSSHDGKALKAIFEFLPRDEIFQATEDDLLDIGMSLLALEAKPGVRLFVRRDATSKLVSCMVFVPREYFSTQLRLTVIERLETALGGQLESFTTQMTESPLARLYIIIRAGADAPVDIDIPGLETEIAHFTHQWSDDLYAQLIVRAGEQQAEALFRTFASAFPQAYIGRYSVKATVFDIEKCAEALRGNTLAVDCYRRKADPDALHLKLYNPNEESALSDIIPVLENMGFRAIDEHPFLITPQGTDAHGVWIRDFKLSLPQLQDFSLEQVKLLLEEALLKVWRGQMENDGFNRLVIRAGLHWRQVTVLRAYGRYLRQIGFPYALGAIEHALAAQPKIAENLVALFMTHLNPSLSGADRKQDAIVSQIEAQLSEVTSLTEDRILRQYMALILATLRTNYFQRDAGGNEKPVLSFKLKSAAVPGMPKPMPMAEIFVYSVRVEGIHLRGGKVARGGIRWSDRHEDYRTEILGLMKAQMVKNAVIVPVGSKGGFVVRQPIAGGPREAFQAEGVACYRHYLSGMLDITDNIVEGHVTPPPQVVRHDGDDPYLVVAADKGTATFSDIANEISQSYGFWLDDAFASGGSAGYDHKKMAITARGGWVSVVRHFREMGVDISKQEFTCVGVGDMAGDVFGNGMLLSEKMKLVAAFNHMHIFIDPTPDPKASFEERKRLFALPRSTWKDYDAKKISRGGGVFERSAKSIPLNPQVKQALGIDRDALTPDELIRAILTAPVDLLWNGGIGTYVKAEEETHDQVGDRANNSVRINGRELRCKVVGEGGNLGCTQRGRIEYARNGGRINTDAIDNSGGVDCSDHEVNIKIAFSDALASGRLSRDKRNIVLARMTDEVASLVLNDNILQTRAISLAEMQGVNIVGSQARLIRRLEQEGLLDRALEYLPSDRQMGDLRTAGKGLARPELAVLLAYAKIALYRELIESPLPDEAFCASDLVRYFPKTMQKDFEAEIHRHPLRREIIATVLTNSIVNRAGMTFFFDVQEDTNLPPREVAAAYAFTRDAFDLRDLWQEIEKQEAQSGATAQADAFLAVNRLLERVTLWCLRTLPHPMDMEQLLAQMKPGLQEFRRILPQMLTPAIRQMHEVQAARLKEAGFGDSLSKAIAGLESMACACDIISVAQQTGVQLVQAGMAYFTIGERLRLSWLRSQTQAMRAATHWDRLAMRALAQDLYDEQRRLAISALKAGGVETWAGTHEAPLTAYARFLDDLQSRGVAEISALLVGLKHVRMLGD